MYVIRKIIKMCRKHTLSLSKPRGCGKSATFEVVEMQLNIKLPSFGQDTLNLQDEPKILRNCDLK